MTIPLPSWIDPEAWAGFVQMRKAMPKTRPFTDRAAMLILKDLYRIKEAGHCPNAALDQSTLHGWMAVYEPKEVVITKTATAEFEDQQRRQREEAERQKREALSPQAREAKERALASARAAIRRVA